MAIYTSYERIKRFELKKSCTECSENHDIQHLMVHETRSNTAPNIYLKHFRSADESIFDRNHKYISIIYRIFSRAV